ncbi:MAG TPA: CCA tRNA nucleotidyltransferase, partial [Candidatus Xenobia bacterium]|nr:CCA tRNA nucleotidyltransferase [Candidatus Xenobia bacterium]
MPDYIFMLESRLSPEQLDVLNRVQREAQDLSLNLYLVGGAVRDLMTGSLIRDLDFAAEGNPARLVRRLAAGA